MQEISEQEEVINFLEYLEFIKRRKVIIILTTLFVLAAGMIIAGKTPAVYTVSALIKAPSVEHPRRLVEKITRRSFDETTNHNLNAVQARARLINATDVIFLHINVRGQRGKTEGLALLENIILGISSIYQDEVYTEKENIRQLLETITNRENRLVKGIESISEPENAEYAIVLQLMHDEILFTRDLMGKGAENLRLLFENTHNIKIIKMPHISDIMLADRNTCIAISIIAGICLGVVFGFLKEKYSGKASE